MLNIYKETNWKELSQKTTSSSILQFIYSLQKIIAEEGKSFEHSQSYWHLKLVMFTTRKQKTCNACALSCV